MTASLAFPPSQDGRGVAIKTEYVRGQKQSADTLPMRIAVFGQGQNGVSYTNEKRQVSTAKEVGELYGYQSPLYLICRSLLPVFGDGVGDIPVWIYPLSVTGTPVQSTGSVTPSGTGTKREVHYVEINNLRSDRIDVVNGETVATLIDKAVAAINKVDGMPVTASDGTTTLDLTAGWDGDTGDGIYVKWIAPDDSDFSFTGDETTLSGGGGTIAVDEAASGLNLIGEAWDTLVVSALKYTDSTNLDKYHDFGEGRCLPAVRKPLMVFTGTAEASLATVTSVTDARPLDKTNVIVPNPGSNDLPFMIAADAVKRVAVMANSIPSHDYGLQKLTMLTPAPDSVQWNGTQRETAIDAGCSSVIVRDGVVCVSDLVTCYHPSGEDPPSERYVVDRIKLWNIIHNFNGEFDADKWKSGPALVPDDQAVDPGTRAKKPKNALSAIAVIATNLGRAAIISNPEYTIENSTATISGVNPKRLDVIVKLLLAGNTNVIAITLEWSFYYGGGAS